MIREMPVDSDSEDSGDEEEIRIQIPRPENAGEDGSVRKIINICLTIAAVAIIAFFALNTPASRDTSQPQPLLPHSRVQSPKSLRPNNSLIAQSPLSSIPPPSVPAPNPLLPVPIRRTLTLQSLSETRQFGGSNFVWRDLRNGNMSWFTPKEATCLPGMVVNSAAKISDLLYMQKTPYEKVVALYSKVSIPAYDIYQFEAPRQLIARLAGNPDNIIAYCHSNPLLLVLTATASKQGLFVCNSTHWESYQHNLVVNDLLPLAQPHPTATILSSNGYNVLVSDDFSLVRTLLYEQRRELVLIVEIFAPEKIETYVLLKLKAYRLESGLECEVRKLEVYEESGWHIENRAVLMPGWYAFTPDFYPLPIIFQAKNYQKPLHSPRKLVCVNHEQFKPTSQTFNKEYMITNVPYEGFYLMKALKDTAIDQRNYREIVLYFQENPLQSVYFHSGSHYLMLLLVSTLSQEAEVAVSPQFKDIGLLQKNMVLNNLEMLLVKKSAAEVIESELVVTSSLSEILTLKPRSILLTLSETLPSLDLPNYSVSEFKDQQSCSKTALSKKENPWLLAGSYLLIRT